MRAARSCKLHRAERRVGQLAALDLVIAAELLGHARFETTRVYARPTAEDRRKAVALLPTDE